MRTMSGLARLQKSQTDVLQTQAITHSAKIRQPNHLGLAIHYFIVRLKRRINASVRTVMEGSSGAAGLESDISPINK